MADSDSTIDSMIKKLRNPIPRWLVAVAVGLLAALLTVDLVAQLVDAFSLPDWAKNSVSLIAAPIIAVIVSFGANRAILQIADSKQDEHDE